ncbi:MAG: M14 family metallopeptidase [Gemmataceae bacterium]|nr:M14 family metallopeptidase [Gemmataceae bacterium]
MKLRIVVTLFLALGFAPRASLAQFPSPEEYLGHRVGADKKLVKWATIETYFRKAAATDRVRIQELGLSSEGRKMIMAVIATPETLKELDKHKAVQRRLADPRRLKDDDEKKHLIQTSKIVIYINCGIHASETASALMSMELLHELATRTTPEVRAILDKAIVLLTPSSNPDGTDIIANWYESTLGTEWEGGGLPWLYHKYAGHDNNRDWFMLNLAETRNISKMLYTEWFPTVVLDVHQMGPGGARQFVPPYKPPVNPNIDPVMHQATDLLGAHMAMDLARHGKKGVVHSSIFDLWWAGSALSEPRNHNMVAVLSETASCKLATPITVGKDGKTKDGKGKGGGKGEGVLPSSAVTPNSLDPWPGGVWRLRDAVDYQLIVSKSVLTTSTRFHDMFQANYIKFGEDAIARGKVGAPFAWLVPQEQRDPGAARHLLHLMDQKAVEVHRADETFTADGVEYPPGTAIMFAAQPYRAHLKNMMERQVYPKRMTAAGQIERPYDVTGWTLPLQMGVHAVTVAKPFEVKATMFTSGVPKPQTRITGTQDGVALLVPAATNDDFRLINRLHKSGIAFRICLQSDHTRTPAGSLVIPITERLKNAQPALLDGLALRLERLTELKGFEPHLCPAPPPRLAVYQPFAPSMDEGWTRLVLEQFEFPYKTVHNTDLLQGDALRDRFDCMVLPSISVKSLMAGQSVKATDPKYAGGLGAEGVKRLQDFVKSGGTLVCIDDSCNLPLRQFGLPIRNVIPTADDLKVDNTKFFCPGSILSATSDPSHPVGYGRSAALSVYFARSQAFEIVKNDDKTSKEVKDIKVVCSYADKDVLESGFLQGEDVIAGKGAVLDVSYGNGHIILFGCRVQNRAQPHGTFRLLFNAIQSSTMTR